MTFPTVNKTVKPGSADTRWGDWDMMRRVCLNGEALLSALLGAQRNKAALLQGHQAEFEVHSDNVVVLQTGFYVKDDMCSSAEHVWGYSNVASLVLWFHYMLASEVWLQHSNSQSYDCCVLLCTTRHLLCQIHASSSNPKRSVWRSVDTVICSIWRDIVASWEICFQNLRFDYFTVLLLIPFQFLISHFLGVFPASPSSSDVPQRNFEHLLPSPSETVLTHQEMKHIEGL